MPKRCGNAECGKLVSTCRSHVRLGERVFCTNECANVYLVQESIFTVATDPFHLPFKPPKRNRYA